MELWNHERNGKLVKFREICSCSTTCMVSALTCGNKWIQELPSNVCQDVFTTNVFYNCHNLTVLSLPVKKPFVLITETLGKI